jgi:transposase/uncharacterized coiled-coil protein SlyX
MFCKIKVTLIEMGVAKMKKLTTNEINELYDKGSKAVGEFINGLIDIINKQQKLIATQQKQIAQLEIRVKKLEEQVNKNSKNSSKPPSSDGFNKPKSLRKKSSRPIGGQKGHKGETLKQIDNPDHIITHENNTCKKCGYSIEDIEAIDYEKRQVFDVEINIVVTEHQVEKKICPHCQNESKASFPDDVNAPVQYGSIYKALGVYLNQYQLLPYKRIGDFFEDIVGLRPCEATIINFNNEIYDNLKTAENKIKEAIIKSPVVNFDETGINIKGKTNWLHSASTDNLTFYDFHKKRGKEAMDDIEILPNFSGIAVHDFWKSYLQYEQCEHSFCNAHLLRELTGIYENNSEQKWALDMINLLCEINKEVLKVKEDKEELTSSQIKSFTKSYNQILDDGFELNKRLDKDNFVESNTKKRGRKKQSKAKNLLDRFEKYSNEILRFMHDLNVPFDNNLAERDIRMTKLKGKISKVVIYLKYRLFNLG